MPLHPKVHAYATAKNFAALTTLFEDGTPQTQVMWVDADADHLLINTEVHRQKFRNVSRDPRVTVLIWDAENPYRYVEVRGRVVEVVHGQPARDHIDACARRYVGRDYDPEAITSERVLLRIAPDRELVRGA
ncbi:TIGR03618 family F420-dependent PPOX class oxidoreductase [Egicoccus halophilus]|uniref:PPOX class F420-dependent enzyme n=1 Tax=Egicoccus halophilus TaxID=1670830 RepID=A0A8J3AG44_9ACTN|nr:TIGR03618 family F420-dependent PPOX class oxidoreductase [Egicoccus halophilus]GGI08006.1 PPOX class F420-dependent enzyme [Egicoccus halophilus]